MKSTVSAFALAFGLAAFTTPGEALLEYFRSLMAWLQEQNRGPQCGW